MRFLFIIQGEGRGHMTQAIAFSKLLKAQGHDLVGVIVGKSEKRVIPEFFSSQIGSALYPVESPNFESDQDHKKILILKTLQKNFLKIRTFWKSLKSIDQVVSETEPDIILNFYDLLGGLYNFLFRPKAEYWVIGHQYLISHPDFPFAPKRPVEKTLFQLNTFLTALGAEEKLALSFYPKKGADSKIRVVPPLLRKEVKELSPSSEDFILAYMVNPGYAQEVREYAEKLPHLNIKAYWDKKDAADIEYPLPNLSFHRVNDRTFLEDMAACRGLVCTAGFESVCEAMYLGKPVLMIPVAGQYEQACNALDAQASGAGIAAGNFDFGLLEKAEKKDAEASRGYLEWVNSWPNVFRKLVYLAEQRQKKNQPKERIDPFPSFG